MNNYDSIFATPTDGEQEQIPAKDSRKEWIARKQQERTEVYSLIDTTTERIAANGEVFQQYLDTQSRFDRYSVKNAILVLAQRPDATKLASFEEWKKDNINITKGEKGISILVPDKEYARRDGSKGVNFVVGKVFDITQTSAVPMEQKVSHDTRRLLEALVLSSPCPIEVRNDMQGDYAARHNPQDNKIYVRQGLDAPTIFRSVSHEIAIAHLHRAKMTRSDSEFDAYCASYMLCKRFDMPTTSYSFDKLPVKLIRMEQKALHSELKRIRDTANRVGESITQILNPRQKQPVARDGVAR